MSISSGWRYHFTGIAITASLFLGSMHWAQAQRAALQPQLFQDFSGGLNDNFDASRIADNESPNALNVVIDEPLGSLTPRKGFTQCGVTPSGSAASNLHEYFKENGTRRLIVTDNTNTWETGDCVAYSTITTAGTSTNLFEFETVRDKVWMVNRSTHAITWDGTNSSLLDGSAANTPNPAPPRATYIEYWKERVWLARTISNPSGVAFSALTDGAGNDLDPSTGTASWPATNVIFVDEGGGSPIYGIRAFRDNLYVFKDNGIWRIIFNSEFDLAVVKTLSSVGSRFNTSITEIDGILYFVGPDGIYGFDGDTSTRVSEKMVNKFNSLQQPLGNDQFKSWTSQDDFDNGTFSDTTSTSTVGSLELVATAGVVSNGDFETGDFTNWTVTESGIDSSCGTDAVTASIDSTTPIEGSNSAKLKVDRCTTIASVCTDNGETTVQYSVLDESDNVISGPTSVTSSTETVDMSAISTSTIKLLIRMDGPSRYIEIKSDTFQSFNSFSFIWDKDTGLGAGCAFSGNRNFFDDFRFDLVSSDSQFFTSGTWTSDIFDAVTISSWTTFEVTDQANGGSTSYEVRVGTDSGAVQSNSFVSIIPGALISGTTGDTNIQVRATLNAPGDQSATPRIDDITVNYSQGVLTNQPIFGAARKNRYWVSAASGTADSNNVVLVKTKVPNNNWIPYDLQVGPMTRFNDKFYAAASTHSAIYRLDNGTNDNGVAIYWQWETKDGTWGAPYTRKNLQEISVDFRKGNAENMVISFSRDQGQNYTDKTVDMSGTGRGTKLLLVNGGNSSDFRFKISNATLDENATVMSITGWAMPYKFRER